MGWRDDSGRSVLRLGVMVAVCCAAILTTLGGTVSEGQANALDLTQPGTVVLMRHALAPGTGDPDNFQIGQCSTQRNLNDRGRAQSEEIGAALRAAGLSDVAVYTSQWCRCEETAELLGIGPVTPEPALNSFFGRPHVRAEILADFETFVANLPEDGPPVVMVTHMVNIFAIAGRSVASGGMVVMRRDGDGLAFIGPWEGS
ncbi:MAG: histidine phosphatase family protein [Rhodospirillaceae bacterium]